MCEAAKPFWEDKDVVLAAVRQNGIMLRDAPDSMKGDKDVVLAAVSNKPDVLKFALNGLNQDKDCLIAAGLWDDRYDSLQRDESRPLIVMSTRFSLDETSNPTATQFTTLLKQHPYIQTCRFVVYSPNAFNKTSCDPNWTDISWPCRGTKETCSKIDVDDEMGVPTTNCCWRYSFRHRLVEAKARNGFMLQLVELRQNAHGYELGNGQAIELEMARDVGVKVFQVMEPLDQATGVCHSFRPMNHWPQEHIPRFIDNFVKPWYDSDDSNHHSSMDVEEYGYVMKHDDLENI